MKIEHITLLVKDFDDALSFYVEKLGFAKRQDTKFWGDNRWVTVSPRDQPEPELTFVLVDTEEKKAAVGKQAEDHVLMTLQTDDGNRDYQAVKERGVKFCSQPTDQIWGVEVVFEVLCSNLFDLVQ